MHALQEAAIGYAYEAIKHGYQTVMVAGGGEELCPTESAVFDTLFATSLKNDTPEKSLVLTTASDGLVIGEGAGTLVLEEYEHAVARGAKIYAEIIGFASNCDAAHVTQPQMETMQICMEKALKDAQLPAEKSVTFLRTVLRLKKAILQRVMLRRIFSVKCRSVH